MTSHTSAKQLSVGQLKEDAQRKARAAGWTDDLITCSLPYWRNHHRGASQKRWLAILEAEASNRNLDVKL